LSRLRKKVYILLVLVLAAGVLIRQTAVRRERSQKIISTISQWEEFGKPVTVRKIKREKVREYARFSVLRESDRTASGFVTRDLQERLNQGQEVYLKDQSLEPEGVISGISREMDVDTGMFYVQVRADRTIPEEQGLTVVYVHTETFPDKIAVPNEILDIEQERFYIWKVVDSKAVRSEVFVLSRNGYGAIISKGLQEEDLVICSGQSQLREGDRIRPVVLEKCSAGAAGGVEQ